MQLNLVKAAVKTAVLVCLFISSDVFAQCCNYPTKWMLVNLTRAPIYLGCVNTSYSDMRIHMETEVPIQPGGSLLYTWSRWWYNDGLGLNAGTWKCAVDTKPVTLEKAQSNPQPKMGFESIDWGENITLTLTEEGGQTVLKKVISTLR